MKKKSLITGIALVVLAISAFLSIAYGVKNVQLHHILTALQTTESTSFEVNVVLARFPRTCFGILAGAALAVSGGLMQSITRNPIADPSILGVNTGAALFVVCGISLFHISDNFSYIVLAFIGAFLTAIFVYGLASSGSGGATPLKLALAGAAASTALQSLVNTVMLPDTQVMDTFRFWQIGSIGAASWTDIFSVLPFLIGGFVLAFILSPSLNALMLGDDMAVSLGVNVDRVRFVSALAGILLCASITALAGPIGFVGLMVPHFTRLLIGPDMRWLFPIASLFGASLLLICDVLGRVLGGSGELEVGIVTALLGAPFFIFIVRKAKVRSL